MKNIDCVSPQFFYSTFISDRDEGESQEEEDASSGATAKCGTVPGNPQIIHGELLLV